MNIGLYDIDGKIPNIALMKLSTYHKRLGDDVEWYAPVFSQYDKVYASSVFTWSDKSRVPKEAVCGGSGFDLTTNLLPEIDCLPCDYSIYPDYKQAIGFLTRGCSRKCKWCIVPEKEGKLSAYSDVEEIAQDRNELVLLDNNILASDYGLSQIEKIIRLGYKIDFNQGLDARLITPEIAGLLAHVKWLSPIRLACDTLPMLKQVIHAADLLREAGATPSNYFVYTLVEDIEEAYQRVEALKAHGLDPFAQPFRDRNGNEPPINQRRFARWVNHKATFKSVSWEKYSG